jgi:uroporphyrin-III C-methyltransferase/precorrin-2 dehydrogenase/sirohydrochlorin ferrochelatase
MSSDTPAALIEQGTTLRQRVFVGTREILPKTISAADVHAPTLVIVGDGVRLQQKLAWFRPGQ